MPRDNGWTPPADGKAIIINPSSPLTVAREFLDRVYNDQRQCRLLRHRGGFYRWEEAAWSEVGEEAIRKDLYDFLAGCFRCGKEDRLERVEPNIRLVGEVLAALKAVAFVGDDIDPPAWLTSEERPNPREIVVFRNGLLHLPKRRLLSPTPEFFSLNALAVEWAETAPEPKRWLAFLRELWPDDQESIDTLQQIFGYVMTADTRLQKSFMIVGPIRSGKGTIGRVLTPLLGPGNTVTPTLTNLGSHFGRASLIGKRLALVGDAKVGRDSDPVAIAEHILEITGEDGVTIPRKNLPDWTGKLDLKFFVLCTELPQMTDDRGGIASRFVILRLLTSYLGREDPDLTGKLLAELPGITVWAVAGWHSLLGEGGTGRIAQPKSALWDVDNLRNLASDIKMYLDERCDFSPGFFVDKDDLYKDYCSWRQSQGRKVVTKAVFGKKLKTAFPQLDQTRPWAGGGDRPRYYSGLRMR